MFVCLLLQGIDGAGFGAPSNGYTNNLKGAWPIQYMNWI